jgi:ribosomal protein L12E/L44/L45/RPP1/RPP2
LTAVLKAAGATVSSGLLNAVAKALKGRNVNEFFGSVGGSSAPATEAPATKGKAETKAPVK